MRKTDIKSKDYIWNTAAGLLNAAEAVIMSMLITRITDLSDAGVMSIAFAVGNLLMCVGKFGTRAYQVTDTGNDFLFNDYFFARICTVAAMMILLGGYSVYALLFLHYNNTKLICVIMIGLIYAVESIEDVFWGYYQKKGRLAVGAEMFCARWSVILLTFGIILVISGSMVYALTFSFIFSIIVFIVLLHVTFRRICENEDRGIRQNLKKTDPAKIKSLLKNTFPLFGTVFLTFFVINAPKYAIDAYMTDEVQACYGFVAMPLLAIELLSTFVYQPTLVKLAEVWNSGKKKEFLSAVGVLSAIIIILTVICIVGAFFLGIPVLSWVYHVDLSGYKNELIILMIAGGFLAESSYLTVVLTTMRKQNSLFVGYLLVACIAALSMSGAVRLYGTMGASTVYTLLMMVLALIYGGMIVKWSR